jgi:hypothetical protein
MWHHWLKKLTSLVRKPIRTTTLTGGSLIVEQNLGCHNFEEDGGTLTGDGDLLVYGTFTWAGGAMDGTGLTDIRLDGFLNLNGGGTYQGLRTVHNEGTDVSANPGNIFVSNLDTFDDLGSYLVAQMDSLQQDLNTQVYANPLPLLGGSLASLAPAQFAVNLRPTFAGLQDPHLAVVRQTLFDGLGPAGLNLLADADGDGAVTPADVGVSIANPAVNFQITLHQDAATHTAKADFDLALPGLGVTLTRPQSIPIPDVNVGVGYDLGATTFGVSQGSALSGIPEADFLTPGALSVQVSASIDPGTQIDWRTIGPLRGVGTDDPTTPRWFPERTRWRCSPTGTTPCTWPRPSSTGRPTSTCS